MKGKKRENKLIAAQDIMGSMGRVENIEERNKEGQQQGSIIGNEKETNRQLKVSTLILTLLTSQESTFLNFNLDFFLMLF